MEDEFSIESISVLSCEIKEKSTQKTGVFFFKSGKHGLKVRGHVFDTLAWFASLAWQTLGFYGVPVAATLFPMPLCIHVFSPTLTRININFR